MAQTRPENLDYKGRSPDSYGRVDFEKWATTTDGVDYMAKMRERFSTALAGWSMIREDYRQDLRYVSGDPAQQWDPLVKSGRDGDGVPALTMDRLNPLVNQIVNQARQDRPQPKVEPGDGGDQQTASAIEGKLRHILYESHADVAFDHCQACCTSGGFGFWRITKEWVGRGRRSRGFTGADMIQEPRVHRITDPMTVLFDPDVEDPAYRDARYAFKQKKFDREVFKTKFGRDPIPFPFEDDRYNDWGDERKVVVVEYWWVEEAKHRLVQLSDGTVDIASEIEFDESEVVNERELMERIVHADLCDGLAPIEQNEWEGEWIPIIPQVAKEVISEGKRRYVSAIRYSRDPQILTNAAASSIALKLGSVNYAPYLGPKGSFKDKKWRDGKRHFYLEYEILPGPDGQPLPAPQRNTFDPAIQGEITGYQLAVDALKGSVGYVDAVVRPSQADLSGIAETKREDNQNLANVQYEDSLTDSMWHGGRVLVDLLISLADTPRVWDTRSESGESSKVPVTMQVPDDTAPHAAGFEGQPHIDISSGQYVVTVGPSYESGMQEANDFLFKVIEMDPQLIPIYLPAIFKRMNMPDLAEIATAAQPPQIQQAIAQASGKGIPAQVLAAQVPALQQQNAQLKQALQQISTIIKTKQIETAGKLQVQNAKTQGDLEIQKLQTIRAIIEKQMQHTHDATSQLAEHGHATAGHLSDLLHNQLPAIAAPEPPPEQEPLAA